MIMNIPRWKLTHFIKFLEVKKDITEKNYDLKPLVFIRFRF